MPEEELSSCLAKAYMENARVRREREQEAFANSMAVTALLVVGLVAILWYAI